MTVLEDAFITLCDSIEVGCIYKGIESEENGVLCIQIQSKSGDQIRYIIGAMTMVGNAYRLLSPYK